MTRALSFMADPALAASVLPPPGGGFDIPAFLAGRGIGNFLGGLLFESDYIRICPEEPCHLAGQLGVECLVDGGKDSASQ